MERPKKPAKAIAVPNYPQADADPLGRREFIILLGAGAVSATVLSACGGARPPAYHGDPPANAPVVIAGGEGTSIDSDSDGLLDQDDACPSEPEDRDGFVDEDGCPEPDNDGDRIQDVDDKCPNDPETYNGINDDDGCPDRSRGVVVKSPGIQVQTRVYFSHRNHKVMAMSKDVLDAVAATMHSNPGVEMVLVVGNAAVNEGNGKFKLKVSRARSRAVVDYLVEKGVSRDRLKAHGIADSCPVDPGANERAHERNRRTDFKVLYIDGEPSGVESVCPGAVERGFEPK